MDELLKLIPAEYLSETEEIWIGFGKSEFVMSKIVEFKTEEEMITKHKENVCKPLLGFIKSDKNHWFLFLYKNKTYDVIIINSSIRNIKKASLLVAPNGKVLRKIESF